MCHSLPLLVGLAASPLIFFHSAISLAGSRDLRPNLNPYNTITMQHIHNMYSAESYYCTLNRGQGETILVCLMF